MRLTAGVSSLLFSVACGSGGTAGVGVATSLQVAAPTTVRGDVALPVTIVTSAAIVVQIEVEVSRDAGRTWVAARVSGNDDIVVRSPSTAV